MRPLIVSRNVFLLHPRKHRRTDGFRNLRLNLAVRNRNYRVRPSPIKPRGRFPVPRLHRELHLISVTVNALATRDLQVRKMDASNAQQRVLDTPFFLLQLTRIVHVPEHAPTAVPEAFAFRRYAVLGRFFHSHQRAIGARSSHVIDSDFTSLTRNYSRHKHDLSVNARHARALGGEARNFYTVCFIFPHSFFSVFHVKHFTRPIARHSTYQTGRRFHV